MTLPDCDKLALSAVRVPGVINKDEHDAYNVRDKTKFKTMNSTACEAWLNQRTEGT